MPDAPDGIVVAPATDATIQQMDLEALVRAIPKLEDAYLRHDLGIGAPTEVRVPASRGTESGSGKVRL